MSGIVLHIGAAIALAGLAVSAQGAELALANRHPDRSIANLQLPSAGGLELPDSGIGVLANNLKTEMPNDDSGMDDLSTAHILKGRYEFRHRLRLNTHVGLDLGSGEAVNRPHGYTLRYLGAGPYRGSDATLGFSQRMSFSAASDTGIGWKTDLGMLPEIRTKLGIPETLKPADQRGIRFGANYHF